MNDVPVCVGDSSNDEVERDGIAYRYSTVWLKVSQSIESRKFSSFSNFTFQFAHTHTSVYDPRVTITMKFKYVVLQLVIHHIFRLSY